MYHTIVIPEIYGMNYLLSMVWTSLPSRKMRRDKEIVRVWLLHIKLQKLWALCVTNAGWTRKGHGVWRRGQSRSIMRTRFCLHLLCRTAVESWGTSFAHREGPLSLTTLLQHSSGCIIIHYENSDTMYQQHGPNAHSWWEIRINSIARVVRTSRAMKSLLMGDEWEVSLDVLFKCSQWPIQKLQPRDKSTEEVGKVLC